MARYAFSTGSKHVIVVQVVTLVVYVTQYVLWVVCQNVPRRKALVKPARLVSSLPGATMHALHIVLAIVIKSLENVKDARLDIMVHIVTHNVL